jgi:hypothetical protein
MMASPEYQAKQRAMQDKNYKQYLSANQVGPAGQQIKGSLSDIERESGVFRPGFETMRNRKTGELLDVYKQNPFAGPAGKMLQKEALSKGPSAWANMALKQQGLEEQGGRDAALQQAMQASGMAQADLARTGGISSGARGRLAAQSARDALLAQQGVSRQGMLSRAGINTEDMARRQGLLGQVAGAEAGAQGANVGATMQDLLNKGQFDINLYKEQMGAYGAKKAAQAQAAAAGGGGKK